MTYSNNIEPDKGPGCRNEVLHALQFNSLSRKVKIMRYKMVLTQVVKYRSEMRTLTVLVWERRVQ